MKLTCYRGPSFPIGPEVFLEQFQAKSEDVPIAAAVALGLAGAGSVENYLPVIMQRLQANNAKDQYLLLHSLKEVIRNTLIHLITAHTRETDYPTFQLHNGRY